jgi:hypothetical protein
VVELDSSLDDESRDRDVGRRNSTSGEAPQFSADALCLGRLMTFACGGIRRRAIKIRGHLVK